MTRAEAKQKLISFGVAEPTDEQITELLNSINAETKKEKDKAEQYKAEAEKAKDLQTQLDEINGQNMSELEKANKALETANQQIADLQRTNAIRDLREKAMSDFKITAEQAKSVVKDDGSFDTSILGQIIVEKETASANAKEQEIANKAGNPGGQGGSSSESNVAVEMAKAAAKRAGTVNESILNNYRR